MIELLIGLAIGLYGYTRLASAGRVEEKPSAPAPAQVQAPQPKHRLTIKDTEPFIGEVDFLRQFGVPPKIVQEVRVFKGPASADELPFQIQDCVKQCYERGDTRGPDVAQLMAGARSLDASEAVYFVLVRPAESIVALVAFVDRIRA